MGLKSKPLDLVRASVPVHEVTKEEMVTVYFNVAKSIKRRWMAEAFQREMTLTDFIIETMEASLGKGKAE